MNKRDTMLLRMIKNSKGQFAAVLVIIMVGIAVYAAMAMASINMRSSLEAYYKQNDFVDLFLEVGAVTEQKLQSLARIDGVGGAQGRVGLKLPMIAEDAKERITLRVLSTDGGEDELNKCTLLEGTDIIQGSNQTWLLKQFAEARGINVGDSIKLQAGKRQYALSVVGIVSNPEYIYLMESAQSLMPDPEKYGVCYVSKAMGRQMAGIGDNFNEIIIKYDTFMTEQEEDSLIEDTCSLLKASGIRQITKKKDQLSNNMIEEELSQLKKISSSVPLIFLLVAGLILMMMLGRMVKRDRIKIGVMKAMGFTDGEVMRHYVKYAALAGAFGGGLGGVLGMLLSGAMTKLYLQFFNIPLMKVEFYWHYVLLAIVISTLFSSVAGMVGARKSVKIAPADAMRSEAPRSGKRIFLERFPKIWEKLSFSHKLVLRNIFRNRKRAIFVLLGISVTYAMMLFTTSMPGAVDEIMNKNFQEFQRMDYNITFGRPVNLREVQDLRHMIDVQKLEPKLEHGFELASGNRKQPVMLVGLLEDTSFYSFENSQEQPVKIPKEGILLTENLAKMLKAGKGDMVLIKTYLPGRENCEVRVADVIRQPLGMNGYMSIDYMGEMLLEKNMATGALLDTKQENVNESLSAASNIATVMSVEETRALYLEYMTMMFLTIGTSVAFAGLLGFCIVYNAAIISIGEREMEFSSLRVLGFGKNEIFKLILNENSIIMTLGMVLGIPLGKLMLMYCSATFSTNLYTIILTATPKAYGWALVFTVTAIIAAQMATYQKIQKLDFLQALKNRES